MKKLFCAGVVFIAVLNAFAQADTNYVRQYNDRFVVALFQSKRDFRLLFNQHISPDSANRSSFSYLSNANYVSGFRLDYDKLSLSIGLPTPVTPEDLQKKGRTKFVNYSLSVTSGKFRLETSYRAYRGFYDEYTAKHDTAFADSLPYFQNPHLFTRLIKIKFFFFLNPKKRFSYAAAYANTHRQFKSAGTFILVGNLYNQYMHTDASFVPPAVQSFYGVWNDWNYFNMYGFSLGPGYTCNLVLLKKFFLNLTLTLGVEGQYRNLNNLSNTRSTEEFKLSVAAADFRTSFGFNGKNFFISIVNLFDVSGYRMGEVDITSTLLSTSFNIGYRFPFKEGNFVRKMKENKIYKML